MAYNFGQMLSSTYLGQYLNAKTGTLETFLTPSIYDSSKNWKDWVYTLSGDNQIQHEEGAPNKYYFIQVAIQRHATDTSIVTVRLANSSNAELVQTIKTLTVEPDAQQGNAVFNIIINPNNNYNRIEFRLRRTQEDDNIHNQDGTYGKQISMTVQSYALIANVITLIGGAVQESGKFKQIGVQGYLNLQMCIDGEDISVGKTGIYEINHGYSVSFLGFIYTNEDASRPFILDYQY